MILYSKPVDSKEARDEILKRVGGIKGADSVCVQILNWSDKKQRSLAQNNSIYAYCQMVASGLNDSGQEMYIPHLESTVPWSKEGIKLLWWAAIQDALLDKKSSTQLAPNEVSQVYDVMAKVLAEKHGLDIPFPSSEPPMLGERA